MIERKENEQYAIEIHNDETPLNPRNMGTLGTMVCFHSRYNLGDEQYDDVEHFLEDLCWDLDIDFEEELAHIRREDYEEALWELVEDYIIDLPLYVYEHSGIAINTSGFSSSWDSGQLGWIYVTKEKVKEEYGNCDKETRKMVRKVLKHEVDQYSKYVNGEVYGYVIYEKEKCKLCGSITEERVHSCWGFFDLGHMNEHLNSHCVNVGSPALLKLREELSWV